MRLSILLGLLGMTAMGCWEPHASAAATNAPPRRVLVLHSFGREYAPFNVMSATFRTELARRSPVPVEFHEASLDMALFSGGIDDQAVVDYLRALFAERRLDLIATMGGPAGLFIARHRQEVLPKVPLLTTFDFRRQGEVGPMTNAVLVPLQLNPPGLIEDILQVRPATTNIIVVLGADPFEQYWAAVCQREFSAFTNSITFTYWNTLSLETMCRRAGTLPPNSAVLYGGLILDAAGIPHEQQAALAALYAACNAPLFGGFENELGHGIVGGRLVSLHAWGQRAAETALRILDGEPTGQIKCPPTSPGAPLYDWRELQRWHIGEDRLPPGSEIRFRQPTTWEQHKWLITGALLEAALIVLLVFNLTKRRRVEQLLRESITKQRRSAEEMQRLQLEAWHADRVARTGAITSSLAHELNQPLAATLSAAQAGLRFLAAERHEPNDIREILESIVQDTKRAGSVVSGLRAMLRRQTSQRERINLAHVTHSILDLLHGELLTHRVQLRVQCPPDCHVVADKTQIQQVILNLTMNAIEAMQQLREGERRIEIAGARDGADTVQLSVSDSGPGIPEEKTAKLFEAFWTTKPQGLGIGLAICRSILESHGGRIWLAHSQPGKTTFCFSLPLDPRP